MRKSKKLNQPIEVRKSEKHHATSMLGQRIRTARTKAGMTQADLARLCAVTSASVGQWESGATLPALDRLIFISNTLAVDPIWLTFGEAERQPGRVGNGGGAFKSSLRGTRIPLFSAFGSWSPGKYPTLSIVGARRRERGTQPTVMSHFPVDASSWAMVVSNNENEPDFGIGDIVVVDPKAIPNPGNFVLVEAKLTPHADAELAIRQYRRLADGVQLAARNPDWGTLSMSDEAFKAALKGTVAEHTKRLRS